MKKKTTGLKAKLEPRKKVMKPVDVEYDFKTLGKWKESTLIKLADHLCVMFKNMRIFPYKSVAFIETTYDRKVQFLHAKLKRINSKRFFFPTLRTISRHLEFKALIESDIQSLDQDHNNYIEVMVKLVGANLDRD